MDDKFLKPYDSKSTESRIYEMWEKSGYFNPDNLPGERKKPFTIMIAPPNITGSLHMGHALENTISDILIRHYRMKGCRTLWVPGTDHAGIATQNVVEKDLKKQGLTKHELGREKFLEKIWEWKDKYGDTILNQLKSLGASMDWSRLRFTMDEEYQKSVKEAFEYYKNKDLIYQGERVINWCIKDQTALSDLELEYVEEKAQLWFIKYPVEDSDQFIVVATTRPETLLGDSAVAVNPSDERYEALIGKMAILPILNKKIPIIADRQIDKEFGTGAVKVTPAHDMFDSKLADAHFLPYLKVINEVGKIINSEKGFDGLKIKEAREKVIEKIKELGFLEKEEEFTHNVAKCYRCGSTIEPMLSKQWFLKMKPLAEKAMAAIKKDDLAYFPPRWKDISLDWLENIKDWCISRQIWWGHRIPIEGSEDTFDTWFSSALWPMAALNEKDRKIYYPTQFITSARDILHLWISRMIFSGLEFKDQVPFKDILIHATILTKDGKRMSKSLGTGLDPIQFIEKYGADATRFGLIYQEFGGQEIRFNEDAISMGKKFANKLWNITRYVLEKTEGEIYFDLPENFDFDGTEGDTLFKNLRHTIEYVTNDIEAYKFGSAAHVIYDFIWHDFADKYIEYSKNQNSIETKIALGYTLVNILKLLHPFMPFITEEIWQSLPKKFKSPNDKEFLMISPWPDII